MKGVFLTIGRNYKQFIYIRIYDMSILYAYIKNVHLWVFMGGLLVFSRSPSTLNCTTSCASTVHILYTTCI